MALEVQFGDTVIRSAPVVGAAGVEAVSRFLGLTLSDWFYVVTIAYTIIQGWAVVYRTLKQPTTINSSNNNIKGDTNSA